MTSYRMRGVRHCLAAAAGALLIVSPAAAAPESLYPPGAVVQPLPDADKGAQLRDHLKTLAENPGSTSALVAAGRAALAMGDAEAAVSFFARADEASPGDARVKAGMASALARMGQGQAALNLFGHALALGAPEIEIAGDRGLAFELIGDPASAQRDYARLLAARDDPEVRRRLALSLAISGEREAALAALDPQLRQQDRAAWRTRVFVLALTGDAAGAAEAARVTMPPGTSQAMTPFLARLAALSPAQKAMAVHLGHFPSDHGFAARADDVAADPGAIAFAQGAALPDGRGTLPPRRPAAEPVSRAPRRRPGNDERIDIGVRPVPSTVRRRREREAAQAAAEAAAAARRAAPPAEIAQNAATPPVAATPAPPPEPVPQVSEPVPQPFEPMPVAAAPDGPEPGFEEVAALVASLPVEPPSPAAAAPAPAAEPARAAPKPRAERPAAPAHPSRHWVQIAGGADRTALPREFRRLAELAPELLNGRNAWTTPLRFTNRLLVGPFDSEAEAQAFVNLLAVKEVAAFAWTSPAGQEIQRLSVRR